MEYRGFDFGQILDSCCGNVTELMLEIQLSLKKCRLTLSTCIVFPGKVLAMLWTALLSLLLAGPVSCLACL